MNLIYYMCSENTLLKTIPPLPGAKELKQKSSLLTFGAIQMAVSLKQ